jgi:hypothetical protein
MDYILTLTKLIGRVFVSSLATLVSVQAQQLTYLNGNRPTVDAHNCYPYDGRWGNRIDRALQTGFPVGIEQDMAWYVGPTGKGRAVITHSAKTNGQEPTLRQHFFERVRPIIEKALAQNNRAQWPIIILHFDFKDNQAPLLHAVWELLGEYSDWITTAPKGKDPHELAAFEPKPLLVLTEDSDAQEEVFFNQVPVGAKLRVFGSAHTNMPPGKSEHELIHLAATLSPEQLLTERPTNYRRWWNNSWNEVEEGGQRHAGDWTPADASRLRELVDHAHQLGYWIRFYTLDGFPSGSGQGWSNGYNFGNLEAARIRWKASIEAGVNLIASDQYEDLAAMMPKIAQ